MNLLTLWFASQIQQLFKLFKVGLMLAFYISQVPMMVQNSWEGLCMKRFNVLLIMVVTMFLSSVGMAEDIVLIEHCVEGESKVCILEMVKKSGNPVYVRRDADINDEFLKRVDLQFETVNELKYDELARGVTVVANHFVENGKHKFVTERICEPIDAKCIAGTVGGAATGGVAGASSPIVGGTVIGAIGGALVGAVGGGCFD